MGRPLPTAWEEQSITDAVLATVLGLGRIQPLLEDPDISDIHIRRRQYEWPREPRLATSEPEVQRLFDASVNTIAKAVAALKDAGDDAIVSMVKVRGKLFRVVLHYPGDNAVGMVFPLNSSIPVAEIQDSDVVCRNTSARAAR